MTTPILPQRSGPRGAKQGIAAVTTSWLFICFPTRGGEPVGQGATVEHLPGEKQPDLPLTPCPLPPPPRVCKIRNMREKLWLYFATFRVHFWRLARYAAEDPSSLSLVEKKKIQHRWKIEQKQAGAVGKHTQWPVALGETPDVSNLSQRQVRGGRQVKEPNGSFSGSFLCVWRVCVCACVCVCVCVGGRRAKRVCARID